MVYNQPKPYSKRTEFKGIDITNPKIWHDGIHKFSREVQKKEKQNF